MHTYICGIVIEERWRNNIDYYGYRSKRILLVCFKLDRGHLCLTGIHVLEEGKDTELDTYYESITRVPLDTG